MRKILVAAGAVVLVLGLLVGCGKSGSEAKPSAPASASASTAAGGAAASRTAAGSVTAPKPGPRSAAPSAAVPARVTATLARIDAGDWPPKGDTGTQGGRHFGNFEGLLPKTGPGGKKIDYTEWDVNAKQAGRGRDAERIITGSDGSAWFTLDHYKSFTRIR